MSSGPSTPALLTAGLAGATDTRPEGNGRSSSFAATAEFARYTLLQFKPVLDRKRRAIGTRISATINATPVLNAFVTQKGGGISYEPTDHCIRNYWP